MPERITLPLSDAPRVSVIIPCSSKLELLLACLRSLAAHGPAAIPYETIVLLNDAGGDAEARLRKAAAGLRVDASPVNLGLAGAGNRGRALARGELLALLHDDAEVEPGWLEALVATADAHPEAGAVGSLVLFPDGRLQGAGMILWRDAVTSPPWFGGEPPSPSAFDRLRAVDYSGTCSLLVRAATWDAIGGLDERFYPVYYVDVDLAMATRRCGQVVLHEPRSRIRHHQGASGSVRFRHFLVERHRRLFVEKWGRELEEHEPPKRRSPVAFRRALARAEELGERRRLAFPAVVAPDPAPPPPYDRAAHEREHLEKAVALQRDYAAHLTTALDEAIAEAERRRQAAEASEREESRARARKEAELAAMEAELTGLRARVAVLDAIERGWWWRLYQRLLPLFRALRRLGGG
jgi:GT2 family glycosyltransferase